MPDTTTTDPAPNTTTPATTTAPAPTTVASTTVAAAQASAQLVGIVFTAASSQGSITACQRQLEVVLGAQQDVSATQNALAMAVTNLDDLLDRRMAAVTTPSTTEPPSTDGPGSDVAGRGGPQVQGGQLPSGIAGGGGVRRRRFSGGSVSASPSSADLIAYQRDVDAAQASLLVAQQALKQAAVASPIDGHVVAVDLAAGDAVTVGSTTATIVVVGDGGDEVTTTVAVADLPKVEVGQQADVVIDGSSTALDGTVVAIGVAATSTTGATTYPVSISLPAGTEVLDGSVASVAVVTSSAKDALAVPNSAVHTTGSSHTVDVLEDGKAHRGRGRRRDRGRHLDRDHERADRRPGGRAGRPRRGASRPCDRELHQRPAERARRGLRRAEWARRSTRLPRRWAGRAVRRSLSS